MNCFVISSIIIIFFLNFLFFSLLTNQKNSLTSTSDIFWKRKRERINIQHKYYFMIITSYYSIWLIRVHSCRNNRYYLFSIVNTSRTCFDLNNLFSNYLYFEEFPGLNPCVCYPNKYFNLLFSSHCLVLVKRLLCYILCSSFLCL